ncbi:BN159_2729 family protein [Streptomyces sp. NPDC092369]|uniref:BN159_2729 family protein n=1 Tax=Streptomyces sp. NPDC092369 TaxID=3366015 RepID=UPI00380D5262
MTTESGPRADIEQRLAAQLAKLAGQFVAELEDQGRLVGPGDAKTLAHLRSQIEARRDLPEAYQIAVETIVDDCGYPSAVATRIATALRRKGLLGVGDEPEPQHAPAPPPNPADPSARGATVMTLTRPPVDGPTAPVVRRVEGQSPQIRPNAAQSAGPTERAHDSQEARGKAIALAARLQTKHEGRLELTQIAPSHDRVAIAIRATSLSDWEYWLDAIGTPPNLSTRTAGYAQIAFGRIEGIEVHLTAHDVPRLLHEAEVAAADPFYLWGRIYDLTRGQTDKLGRLWMHLGQRQQPDNMPLMALRGGNGTLYPLASIVMAAGHLIPTAGAVAPIPAAPAPAAVTDTAGDGGEQ